MRSAFKETDWLLLTIFSIKKFQIFTQSPFSYCWTLSLTLSKMRIKSRKHGTQWHLNSVAIKSRFLSSLSGNTLFIQAYSLKFISASNAAIKDDFIFSFCIKFGSCEKVSNFQKINVLLMKKFLRIAMAMVMLMEMIKAREILLHNGKFSYRSLFQPNNAGLFCG